MSKFRKNKIIIGVSLIVLGGFILFLIIDNSPQTVVSGQGIDSQQVVHSQSENNSVDEASADGMIHKQLQGISLGKLVEEAQAIYGQQEELRKKGFLWVDRKSDKFVATLGILNGVEAGSYLSVYQGENLIGRVQVQTSFDVISYVTPESEQFQLNESAYYQVVLEN